jgi:acetylornithine deacetylase
VIAGHCAVEWEMRPVQAADVTFVKKALAAYAEGELLPAMRAVYPAAAIETEVVGEVAGLEPAAESEAREIALALTGGNGTDAVAFGTEAGLFQSLGISTVVCGPGSIAQAHKPDEFVETSQLAAALSMLEGLAGPLTRR